MNKTGISCELRGTTHHVISTSEGDEARDYVCNRYLSFAEDFSLPLFTRRAHSSCSFRRKVSVGNTAFLCESQEVLGNVWVLNSKPFFLQVDIQHSQCPCRFFNPREIQAMWSQTTPQRYYIVVSKQSRQCNSSAWPFRQQPNLERINPKEP